MVTTSAQPASRYRRRIVGIGAFATGALYVIGAPIFVDRIESDLESRVPAELAAAGFAGVTASFSGQDGDLTCDAPLDDPEGARSAAYDVNGVRAIELDRSCRVNTAASLTDAAAADERTDVADETSADETSAEATVAVASTTGTTSPDDDAAESSSDTELATVQDVVAANADLAFLAVLLADTDIGRSDRLITLFAPSNEAFDAVPADVLSRMQNDPTLLEQVLEHHVVDGALMSGELVDGDLVAEDGTMLPVVVGDEITVGGGTLTETDIIASNGVVHVIDTVLAPVGQSDVQPASLTIDYDGELVALSGIVASEVERQVLVDAATGAVGANFVTDEMTTDPDAGVGADVTERVAQLIVAMPLNLLSGAAGTDGDELFVTGVARTAAGRDAMFAIAGEVDVEADLEDAPAATDATTDDAVQLEAQLNTFVTENPILFEPSSEVLAESAFAIIDRIAADASAFEGLVITVEGHTDSDGVPIENLQLSQDRAEAVRTVLIERGLAADAIGAVGFGSDQPVLVDGVEDKPASRRVEFRVETTS